jgi:hypothetical protein
MHSMVMSVLALQAEQLVAAGLILRVRLSTCATFQQAVCSSWDAAYCMHYRPFAAMNHWLVHPDVFSHHSSGRCCADRWCCASGSGLLVAHELEMHAALLGVAALQHRQCAVTHAGTLVAPKQAPWWQHINNLGAVEFGTGTQIFSQSICHQGTTSQHQHTGGVQSRTAHDRCSPCRSRQCDFTLT